MPPIPEYSPSVFSLTTSMSSVSGCHRRHRRRHAGIEPNRPQVDVLVEPCADLQQRLQRDVIRHLAGVADAAEEDRVEVAQRFEGIVRHHLADLEVAITAPVEGLERDVEAVLGGGRRPVAVASAATSGPTPSPGITAMRYATMSSPAILFACHVTDTTGARRHYPP